MKNYSIPMVPGPVRVPRQIREIFLEDYGSADLEPEFFELYAKTQTYLKELLGTRNDVVIMTGEAMVTLWGALKSCILPGDRVLAIATGVFGNGIAEMARSIGADVKTIPLADNETISDFGQIEKAIADFKPKMITAVHCETPSGTLNPLSELGKLKQKHGVPLFYVDAVSSVGGAPAITDARHIDLCLGGSQKCISAPPGISFLSVSDKAWEIIEQVGYVGYDALNPFKDALEKRFFPYTPDWQGIAALSTGARLISDEGLAACIERHNEVAVYCRKRIIEMGLNLFPSPEAIPSPTVTAVRIPDRMTWGQLDEKLRKRGMVVGSSLGALEGKVFRIGHMGSQARMDLVTLALDVLETVL